MGVSVIESLPPERYAIFAVETVSLGNLGIDLGCDSLLLGRWCSRTSPISSSGHITLRLLIFLAFMSLDEVYH
jgi:hypothetical protein